MEDRIKLSYFYGREADQYSFYRIPKLLFTEEYFKKISVEAKVLYGLMLDRMSLSMKNQWFDTEGRAYIYYSLEDIDVYKRQPILISRRRYGEAAGIMISPPCGYLWQLCVKSWRASPIPPSISRPISEWGIG